MMFGGNFQKMLDLQLIKEADEGNVIKMAELLSKGANVNASLGGFTLLIAAATKGHLDVCKLLFPVKIIGRPKCKGYPIVSCLEESIRTFRWIG